MMRRKKTPLQASLAAVAPMRAPVARVVLTLPTPPSVNALWRTAPLTLRSTWGGMICSRRYQQWKTAAGMELVIQRPGRIEGRYRLEVNVPLSCKGDLDNYAKAVSDLLQQHGIIENDRLAQRVLIDWTESDKFTVEVVAVAPTREAA